MGNVVNFFTGNLILNLAILAWFIAQVLKIIITFCTKKKLDWHYLVASGGMPSSHSGEQAKILNYIMDHWTEMKPALFGKELKELLGHTPFQVLMGGVLGVAVGLFGAWQWS